jgi:hypothetical protein
MPELHDRADEISNKEALAWFIAALADSLDEAPDLWENDSLEAFLRAWSAWLHDSDGYFRARGEEPPQSPSWSLIGKMLLAARVYE